MTLRSQGRLCVYLSVCLSALLLPVCPVTDAVHPPTPKALHPGTAPLGLHKGEPYYPRAQLSVLHTVERWRRDGRQVGGGGVGLGVYVRVCDMGRHGGVNELYVRIVRVGKGKAAWGSSWRCRGVRGHASRGGHRD